MQLAASFVEHSLMCLCLHYETVLTKFIEMCFSAIVAWYRTHKTSL